PVVIDAVAHEGAADVPVCWNTARKRSRFGGRVCRLDDRPRGDPAHQLAGRRRRRGPGQVEGRHVVGTVNEPVAPVSDNGPGTWLDTSQRDLTCTGDGRTTAIGARSESGPKASK